MRRSAAGRAIAVTEKDAVKLSAHAGALPGARVLALAVEIESGEGELREAVMHTAMKGRNERG